MVQYTELYDKIQSVEEIKHFVTYSVQEIKDDNGLALLQKLQEELADTLDTLDFKMHPNKKRKQMKPGCVTKKQRKNVKNKETTHLNIL
jgi:hypothetical protein